MQAFFKPIDAADYRQQVQQIADHLRDHPPSPQPTPPSKRSVGRPKLKRTAEDALASAAAAAALPLNVPEHKRGKYTRWFDSPYINDIIAAYVRSSCSARRAVTTLQLNAPDRRFDHLSHSTVASWFENGKLKPQHQRELDEGRATVMGRGPCPVLLTAAGADEAICNVLLKLREAGTPLNSHIIRWVMHAILQDKYPAVLSQLTLSQAYISGWVRNNPRLQFRWRARTTAAFKLPLDWEEQGILMAQRMAAAMHLHKVHPSLVINMDQTGVHLVPTASWTYEKLGSSSVAMVGAEDKRQITACVAASLRGDMLPLQLIFQGKTPRSLPPATAASVAACVDVTHSTNHWSTQETMQRWITKVLLPHAERMISLYQLNSDSHIVLLLDAWAVHKSAEFRNWLQREHPHIHLVYVPANCTSKLQLADVALQRPFKSSITQNFNQWAAETIAQQIRTEEMTGIAESLGMKALKPLILQWCVESWNGLRERKQLILEGWERSCTSLFNIHSEQKRLEAVELIALKKLDADALPEGTEEDGYLDLIDEEEVLEDDDELDVTKPRQFGKQSGRARTLTKQFGYTLDSGRIEIDEQPTPAAAAAASTASAPAR